MHTYPWVHKEDLHDGESAPPVDFPLVPCGTTFPPLGGGDNNPRITISPISSTMHSAAGIFLSGRKVVPKVPKGVYFHRAKPGCKDFIQTGAFYKLKAPTTTLAAVTPHARQGVSYHICP